jgi:hypothetical protein
MKAKTFRYALLFTLSLILTGVFSDVTAQPRVMRFKANKVIRRTAIVLHAAHKQLRINKHFTGNFARAIAHQRFAKRQYLRGNFRSAIHHSRRARMLALTVIRDNKGTPQKDWEFSKEENMSAGKDNPTDEQLDSELMKDNPNLKFSDEELMDAAMDDIDVDEIVNEQ